MIARGVPNANMARFPRASPGSHREPVHPGYFLDTRYLKPLGLTQVALAEALGISRRRVNELVVGRRRITPDTAVRLGAFFRTEPGFWLQMQAAWDAHRAMKELKPRRN